MNAKDSEEDHRETLCAGKMIFDPNRHGAGEDPAPCLFTGGNE